MDKFLKWQPIMLIVEKRFECRCGNLAIFVVLDNFEKRDGGKEDMDFTAWCQDCSTKYGEDTA